MALQKRAGVNTRKKRNKLLIWVLVTVLYYSTLDLMLAPTFGVILTYSGPELIDSPVLWDLYGGQDFLEILDCAKMAKEKLTNLYVVDSTRRSVVWAFTKPNLFLAEYEADEEVFEHSVRMILRYLNIQEEYRIEYDAYEWIEKNLRLGIAFNPQKHSMRIVYNTGSEAAPTGARYWPDYLLSGLNRE